MKVKKGMQKIYSWKLLTQYDRTLKTNVLGKGFPTGYMFIDLSKTLDRLNYNSVFPKLSAWIFLVF